MTTSKRASQRRAVAMDDEQVASYLASHMKVQVASIGRDGMPHLTTLFYVVHEGRIAFWTYATSQKIKNLERDPRVSALVESGTDYFELAGVSVQGRAEIVRDHDRIREIGSRVSSRMAGVDDITELGDLGRDIVEKQVLKRVAVLVTPDKVASWDHSRMNALPGEGGKP
jgi:PPOX class probable F420-dependent enzyme